MSTSTSTSGCGSLRSPSATCLTLLSFRPSLPPLPHPPHLPPSHTSPRRSLPTQHRRRLQLACSAPRHIPSSQLHPPPTTRPPLLTPWPLSTCSWEQWRRLCPTCPIRTISMASGARTSWVDDDDEGKKLDKEKKKKEEVKNKIFFLYDIFIKKKTSVSARLSVLFCCC